MILIARLDISVDLMNVSSKNALLQTTSNVVMTPTAVKENNAFREHAFVCLTWRTVIAAPMRIVPMVISVHLRLMNVSHVMHHDWILNVVTTTTAEIHHCLFVKIGFVLQKSVIRLGGMLNVVTTMTAQR
jgi:hypothetical protein